VCLAVTLHGYPSGSMTAYSYILNCFNLNAKIILENLDAVFYIFHGIVHHGGLFSFAMRQPNPD